MLAAPHIVAGAALGRSLRPPWLAIAVAFLSHFLLDFAPHLDSHSLFGAGGGGVTRAEALGATLDVLVGAALVLWAIRGLPRRRVALGAAFAAAVTDLVDNVPPWNRAFRGWVGTAWLSSFHHGFQHNVAISQWPLGLGIQIAVLAAALWVIRRPVSVPARPR